MLQRLQIPLAQVKAGNTSKFIPLFFHFLYREKENTERAYNIIRSIQIL